MRLLVLDGSRVLPSLVQRLAPEGVEVETADSFEEARRTLCDHPPDAAIINLGPTVLPWEEFRECFQGRTPRIPVLFESCIYRSPEEVGIGCLDTGCDFLAKPYSMAELRSRVEWLIGEAKH